MITASCRAKARADADAGAVAEGQVVRSAARPWASAKRSGRKRVRVLPQRAMAVQRIDRQDHRVAGPDLAAAQDRRPPCAVRARKAAGGYSRSASSTMRRIRGRAGRSATVAARSPSTALRLGPRGGLHGRVEGAEIQRPGQGQRRRLVPGDDEGQQVVAQLVRASSAARSRGPRRRSAGPAGPAPALAPLGLPRRRWRRSASRLHLAHRGCR